MMKTDIAMHEWEDPDINSKDTTIKDFGSYIYISMDEPNNEIILGRDDSIALAKHFKLTAEDLK